jgi:hypothetical protein
MTSSLATKDAEDLLFELLHNSGTRFFYGVIDDATRRREVLSHISAALTAEGRPTREIDVSEVRDDLWRTVAAVPPGSQEVVLVTHLINFERLNSAGLERVFHQLNFHRDAFGRLKIPIVLWVGESQLSSAIALAPDFWSRRSAVYYFVRTPNAKLLSKLFASTSQGPSKWKPESTLAGAFETILSSERHLLKCLRHKKQFSLAKADALIHEIRRGVKTLHEESLGGRQIEVALWLWNLSRLDADLQGFLDRLGPEQRRLYESLYTDRNEALLFLSKELPSILSDYQKKLETSIRSKKPISLVALAKDVALRQIDQMAEDLSSPIREESIPLIPESDERDHPLQVEWVDDTGFNSFANSGAYDLEAWLAGLTDERPTPFNSEEGHLLKSLYESQDLEEIAKKTQVPLKELKIKIDKLRGKVHAYLGAFPTIEKSPSSI